MVLYIPPELLRVVLAHLSSRRDLVRCCSTSQTFLSIAQPLLYNEITLDLFEKRWTNQMYLKSASLTLLNTLKSSPALQQLVQKVKFLGGYSSGIGVLREEEGKVNMKELINTIVDTFPRAKLISFDKLSHRGDLDEAVHASQLGQIDSHHPTT